MSVCEDCYLEILGKLRKSNQSSAKNPTVHMILKSDLKMAQTSARCISYLLFEDDCPQNHVSYSYKLSDVLSNSNGLRQWARPKNGKMSAGTSLSDISLQILHDNHK